jgi:hypothetical protein
VRLLDLDAGKLDRQPHLVELGFDMRAVAFRWSGECIAPTRFCGVGAWRVRSNSAVFLRSSDRSCEDAVVFSGISDDGYFDQAGLLVARADQRITFPVADAATAP